MTKDLEALERAVGVAGAVIASEHFFSTLLSSPWTTQKFADKPEDRELTRKMLFLASGASLLFAGSVSYLIKDNWPLIFTALLVIFYVIVYEKALRKEL
jgi:hypothetical protein